MLTIFTLIPTYFRGDKLNVIDFLIDSDQGIAEFLGASGESLNELSLNNIKKV